MVKFIFIILLLYWKCNASMKKDFVTPSIFLIGFYVISSLLSIPTLYIDKYQLPFMMGIGFLYFFRFFHYMFPFPFC